MKKNSFTGLFDVYKFTLSQTIKNKAYRISTIIVTLIIIIAMILVNVLPMKLSDTDTSNNTKVEVVYIADHSGLDTIEYSEALKNIDEKVKIQVVEDVNPIRDETGEEKSGDLFVTIEKTEDHVYTVKVDFAADTSVDTNTAYSIANTIGEYFYTTHMERLNLTKEQISLVNFPIHSTITDLSEFTEEPEDINDIIGKLVVYFITLGLLMVLLLLVESYGKMTANLIAMEKSSKVVELLLTSIRPAAVIVGKILSMGTLLFIQFFIWIAVAVFSFLGINQALVQINDNYNSELLRIIDLIKETGFTFNLNIGTIAVSLLIIIAGFVLYITLAGIIGASVGRIEELGSAMQPFTLLLIVGCYIPLFGSMGEMTGQVGLGKLADISRLLPISSLYIVPTELLAGQISIGNALISLGILVACLTVLFLFVTRIYALLILHSGNNLKLKEIIALSKKAKGER